MTTQSSIVVTSPMTGFSIEIVPVAEGFFIKVPKGVVIDTWGEEENTVEYIVCNPDQVEQTHAPTGMLLNGHLHHTLDDLHDEPPCHQHTTAER